MSKTLEYQFEIEIRKGIKPKKIVVKTERMPYEVADNLAYELGGKGIHYKVTEFDLRCDNRMQITSRMLHHG
jgi:hypothetical protein